MARVRGRREQVLDLLRSSPEALSIAVLTERLGVHPNTVRFHLDSLTAAGRVERVLGAVSGPGRPPIVYRAAAAMDRAGPSNYRLLATMLTAHFAGTAPDPAGAAIALGRTWGPSFVGDHPDSRRSTRTAAVDRVVDVLGDLGFEPEPTAGPRATEIRLRHCPFLGLVPDHAEIICGLHLGLMQGALAALRGPVTVDRLAPFVEPDLCVAHLAPSSPDRTRR